MARTEELQKAIIKLLDELTYSREIRWTHGGQTYSTSHKGLTYKIEDCGNANWLIITSPAGPLAIPDQHEEVNSLLDTIKHDLFAYEVPERMGVAASAVDQELSQILATLTKEA